jgi:hypothetical protein
MLYERLKNYIILVRAYSLIDIVLLFLLAKELSIGLFPFTSQDLLVLFAVLSAWCLLTLALEAKHKHAYRASISYTVPVICFIFSGLIGLLYNPSSLLFLCFITLFTNFYIKKEMGSWWGKTSFVWRGLYQSSLFLFSASMYYHTPWLVSFIIFLLYMGRNLVADVRDIAFDRHTFSVYFGKRASYYVVFSCFFLSSIALFQLTSALLVALPSFIISGILLFYDEGFTLHRIALLVTSTTCINLTLYNQGSLLPFTTLLFLAIVSNFIFYEQVARPSNPVPRVSQSTRFLFKPVKQDVMTVSVAHPYKKEINQHQ